MCRPTCLCTQVWLNTVSALKKGTEVTVEPEGAPAPSAVPAPGSFFATIEEGSTTEGREELYKIRRSGALDSGLVDPDPVPRHRPNPNPNPNPDPNPNPNPNPNWKAR